MSKKKQEPTFYGTTSIVCAILGCFILGLVFCPLAAIFGGIGCAKSDSNKDQVLSIIGLIVGIIGTIICLINFMAIMSIR